MLHNVIWSFVVEIKRSYEFPYNNRKTKNKNKIIRIVLIGMAWIIGMLVISVFL